MPSGGADCHSHTYYSDGTYTPTEVLERAHSEGLEAVAITDHDCLEGLEEGEAAAGQTGVELIPGIEITAFEEDSEIHILGLFVDRHHPELQSLCKERKEARVRRIRGMVEKLRQAGIRIQYEALIEWSGRGVVGRLHVARYVVDQGYAADTREVFTRFLADGKSCFVPNMGLPAERAIRIIREAGGVAAMAHPYLNNKDHLILPLKRLGMQGLEVYHSRHTPRAVRSYEDLARKHDLVMSGGSDCHGMAKGKPLLGKVRISKEQLEKLRACGGSKKSK